MKRHISAEELSAFADGEVAPDRGAAVRAHLDGCAPCASSVASFALVDSALTAGADCAALRPAISAFADGELDAAMRQQVGSHLAACADCRRSADADRLLDARLAALPQSAPNARTDAAIAAIVASGSPAPRGIGGLRLGPTLRLATVTATCVALLLAIATAGGPAPAPTGQNVFVAAQQVVFDTHSNTIYVLDPRTGVLSVLNGTTHLEQARIVLGGRPTALALNPYANTILVLDGTEKRLTEIDTVRNAVVSAAFLEVAGTPTSIQVDPRGQIVVASVLAAIPNGTATPAASDATATPAGQVTVLDGTSKQVKSVRSVDVAPQAVALDPTGQRALLVSARTTTVVDAANYRPIEQLPGGIAAAFDSSGSRIAILSAQDGGANLLFFGDATVAPLQLVGTPLALIALPDRGFAILLNSGGTGHVAVVGSDGKVDSILDAALTGRDLAYDAAARRFAVVGDGGMSYPVLTAQAPPASAPAGTGTPTPAQSATPHPSASPSASPVTSAPVAAASPTPVASGPARFAAVAWTGTYRLELANGRKPVQIAGSGSRVWFVDQYKALGSVETGTGKVAINGQLPADWNYGQLLVDGRLVVAVDQTHGRLAVYDTTVGRLDVLSLAFVASARAFALAPDERLWTGGPGGTLVAVDLSTKRLESVDVGVVAVDGLWVDSGGRVWYADDARKMLGSYDPATHHLYESPLPRAGNIVSLVTDYAGTLWMATDAGEAIPVRPAGIGTTLRIAGLLRVTVDASGRAWYFAATGAGSTFAPLSDLAGLKIAPANLAGPAFDSVGSVWLADAAGAAFYIVTNGSAGRQ